MKIRKNNGEDRISQFDYTLDSQGRKTKAEEWFGNGDSQKNTIDWVYDNAGRLVEESFEHFDDDLDQILQWEYDLVGNVTQEAIEKAKEMAEEKINGKSKTQDEKSKENQALVRGSVAYTDYMNRDNGKDRFKKLENNTKRQVELAEKQIEATKEVGNGFKQCFETIG